jgi:hypothetical protein
VSITARPSTTFTAILTGAPNALGVTLTCGIRELPSGTMVSAAVSTGIVETDVGATSNYVATRTAPAVVSDDSTQYEVVWLVSAVERATEDLHVAGFVTSEGLTPSVADVGVLIHSRTTDDVSNELGTFTADTRPTATEVEALIADGVRDVRRRVGPSLDTTEDEDMLDSARRLAALRTAMYVEQAYFPSQIADGESSYQRLKEMWDEDIAALLATVRDDPGDRQGYGSVAVMSPTRSAFVSNPVPTPWDDWTTTWPGW